MNLDSRISAFIQLADKIKSLSKEDLDMICVQAGAENAWFTKENVARAFNGLTYMLQANKLKDWTAKYELNPEVPKIVGVIMAGNIPLVGFHDLLCVLLAGHFAAIKTSGQDSILIRTVINWLVEIEPRFKKSFEIRDKLTGIDAVIATGSDNTARYFEYYFKNIPSIIRKNRSSIAVLSGNESKENLEDLGKDIFWYFGLGCRNISKALVPEGYKPNFFFESIQEYEPIIHHHKYRNNYDYNRSIYLVNKEPHLDNGFLMWRKSEDLVSPISVLFVQEYKDNSEIAQYLEANDSKIQCVVGEGYTPFGQAQMPELWDYADNVDTLKFLDSLNIKAS